MASEVSGVSGVLPGEGYTEVCSNTIFQWVVYCIMKQTPEPELMGNCINESKEK